MKELRNDSQRAAEQQFGLKVRQVLNEAASQIPNAPLERLNAARKMALRAQKPEQAAVQWVTRAVLAGTTGAPRRVSGDTGWRRGLGLTLVMLVLVGACLAGIFQIEQQRHIDELADLDAALLSDEIPLNAYADHGFNAYLKQNP